MTTGEAREGDLRKTGVSVKIKIGSGKKKRMEQESLRPTKPVILTQSASQRIDRKEVRRVGARLIYQGCRGRECWRLKSIARKKLKGRETS